jgi:hypothetical protein
MGSTVGSLWLPMAGAMAGAVAVRPDDWPAGHCLTSIEQSNQTEQMPGEPVPASHGDVTRAGSNTAGLVLDFYLCPLSSALLPSLARA